MMQSVFRYAIPHKSSLFLLMALVFVFMGASLATADKLVQPDGRLNQVTHFGGDAIYCVDRDFMPTTQYSDFGQGGFRLLNMQGQELWFVPALQISAAVAEAKETGQAVLVGEGMGTYGPVSIYTYVTGENDDYFIFSGYDEYGKPNSITFKFCIPVGPAPDEPSTPETDEEECDPIIIPQKLASKRAVVAPAIQLPEPDPCNPPLDCVQVFSKLLAHKPIAPSVPFNPCWAD